jgi:SCF-associated factor 1
VFSYNPSTLAPAPSIQPAPSRPAEEEGTQFSWSKRLYIGLSNPRTFLWGSEGNGRQGLQDARSGRPYAYRRGIRGINRPKEATWQFDLVRSRIRQERDDRQATEGTQGAGWMANFGNSLRRAAGYGGGRDAVDSRGDTGSDTMASSRGGGDGIVELQAGGWSFAARDMQGVIWVWGTFSSISPTI